MSFWGRHGKNRVVDGQYLGDTTPSIRWEPGEDHVVDMRLEYELPELGAMTPWIIAPLVYGELGVPVG